MRSFCMVISLSLLAFASAEDLNSSCQLKEIVSTDERIRAHGYPAESHYVETEDGYVLNLFRIPYSHKLQNQNDKLPVILMLHGFISNSDCWLATGPNNALAYLMADAGFDVWLGNARGNIYSRKNTKISPNSYKFWSFDWHEIGKIDIPTMIDYIIEITGEHKIHYAGHSQGTTAYFVMMSERPENNMKIKSAHMLAPCAFFEHADSKVFNVFRPLVGKPGGIWNQVVSDFEILPHNTLISSIANTACGTDPALEVFCKNLWLLFAGEGYTNTNVTAMQVLVETHPAGSSSNQGIHFIQLSDHNKGRFCQRDYGPKQNKKIYGQEQAPDYKLANIKAPTYLYSSANDALCGPKDVNNLVANIKYLAGHYRVPEPSFNHLDFMVAHNMKELVNDHIMANIFEHEDSLK